MSAKIYNFQSSRLHRGSGRRRGRRSLLQRLVRQLGVLVALGFMAAGYSAWDRDLPVAAGPFPRVLSFAPEADGAKVIKVAAATRTMPICGSGKRSNCVVDGDTLWLNGEKIRVEGMNAPETKGRCERERRLAIHATQRLSELLSSGSIAIERNGKDIYGRTLATVRANGRDVAPAMVAEGLAHIWRGHKEDWCA